MSTGFDIRALPVTFTVSPRPVTERERAQYRWAVEQGWRAVLQNVGGEARKETAPLCIGDACGADEMSKQREYTTLAPRLHRVVGSKPEVA